MTSIQVKRGEIYYAALDPVLGSETGKTRPVLIIQNDVGNLYSPTTIVAVITEYSEKSNLSHLRSNRQKCRFKKRSQSSISLRFAPSTKGV